MEGTKADAFRDHGTMCRKPSFSMESEGYALVSTLGKEWGEFPIAYWGIASEQWRLYIHVPKPDGMATYGGIDHLLTKLNCRLLKLDDISLREVTNDLKSEFEYIIAERERFGGYGEIINGAIVGHIYQGKCR